jgi:hypothetical protein
MEVTRGWEGEEKRSGLLGTEFQICKMRFLDVSGQCKST